MKITSVSEYIDSLETNGKEAVTMFIDFISSEFPETKPVISYSMPMWKFGKNLSFS